MIEIRYDNTSYMLFVMGYDLLQKKLASYDDCPCDGAYNICIKIYDEFLDSEENQQDKGEYECLQDWIENHTEMIDGFIKQEFEAEIEFQYYVPENDWTISIIWEYDRAYIGEMNEPDKYITVDETETVMNFAEQFMI